MLIPSLVVGALSLGVAADSHYDSPFEYDFVVVGGGTSGLVVANRLSELSNVTVAVIEAGSSVLNNFNVTYIEGYSLAFDTEIDWAYQTEKQTYAGDLKQTIRAGKAIGGMSYTRAEDVQIDNWELVGNKGWNWKSLFPYYKKSEGFEVPTQDQIAHGASYDADYHGQNGPVKVGWPTAMTNSSVFPVLNETFEHLGVHYNRDSEGGKMVGFTVHPDTVDREANVRMDAARAYFWPYKSRSNLNIISNTQANKIIWENTTHGEASANGVEVTGPHGMRKIYASKEVILSAGALRSPALLELSGVGNPDILRKYGIPVKVNLPTVGENLQDQTNNALIWEGKDYLTGLATFPLCPRSTSSMGTEFLKWRHLSKPISLATQRTYRRPQTVFLRNPIFCPRSRMLKIVFAPSGESFAKGVHIRSTNVSQPPAINPNYFMFEQDATAQADVAQFIRKAFGTAPLSNIVGDEVSPGLDVLPANSSSATWNNWVLANYRPNYHPVGTASMLPRENGGVVSPELKVYGTKNVRVIDASVLPFQLCGHLQSTLYAVAEKASDLIKQSHTA
ncbi:hypothetical protein BDW72DRAFT_210463 [Aspergillus terricola var. indicus]